MISMLHSIDAHCQLLAPVSTFPVSYALIHLHNIEMRIFCPQTFLSQLLECEDEVFELK